jgi:hypothetical protein
MAYIYTGFDSGGSLSRIYNFVNREDGGLGPVYFFNNYLRGPSAVPPVPPDPTELSNIFPSLPLLNNNFIDLSLTTLMMKDTSDDRIHSIGSETYVGLNYLSEIVFGDLLVEQRNNTTNWFALNLLYGFNNESLFEPISDSPGKFKIIEDSGSVDFPRDASGNPIGPLKNGSTFITVQISLLLELFHNKVFDEVNINNPTLSLNQKISITKNIVLWHYQFIVFNELLPSLLNSNYNINKVINNVFTNINNVTKEFNFVSSRINHTLTRKTYYINKNYDEFTSFPELQQYEPTPIPSPTFAPDWSMFFPMPSGKGYQVTDYFDYYMTTSLYSIGPTAQQLGPLEPGSFFDMPFIDMLNANGNVPSGQQLATAFGIPNNEIISTNNGNFNLVSLNPVFTPGQITYLETTLGNSTPLYLYLLIEAIVFGKGNNYGPLGSILIGDVLLNLLRKNPKTYINNNFTPIKDKYGCVKTNVFRMSDLICYVQDLSNNYADSLLPNSCYNFYDQYENTQYLTGSGNLQIFQQFLDPSFVSPVGVNYSDPSVNIITDQFDITLIMNNDISQSDINIVAQNCLIFGYNDMDKKLAIVKFIINNNIIGISNETLESYDKPLDFGATDECIYNCTNNYSKLIFTKINESLMLTVDEAAALAVVAQSEIDDALNGIDPPPKLELC